MVDELGPRVGAWQDHLESKHAQRVDDAHGELDQLSLGDELLERILVSKRGEEVVTVHDAVDHAVDQAPKSLQHFVVQSKMLQAFGKSSSVRELFKYTDRCAVAMSDVQQGTPDHADAGMVIYMKK